MAPPPPPPELIEDAVVEILLRVPPDEPAHLFRAALVCKAWLRVLRDPGFLRRYREFHRAPPLLGFLYGKGGGSRLVPTTSAPFAPPAFDCLHWGPLDCRHGRVLVHTIGPMRIFVWDPVTGDNQRLPPPPYPYYCLNAAAAVLCASDGCDHLDCHGKHFRVVFVGAPNNSTAVQVSVYSSETGSWSAPSSVEVSDSDWLVLTNPSILARGSVFINVGSGILKCDLQHGQALSVIEPPTHFQNTTGGYMGDATLVIAEDGELGVACVGDHSIHIWSRRQPASSGGIAGWVQHRTIELDKLIPIAIDDPSAHLTVVGFSETTGTIFICTNACLFAFEVKSGQVRKIVDSWDFYNIVFPYLSFYTPDHFSARLQL